MGDMDTPETARTQLTIVEARCPTIMPGRRNTRTSIPGRNTARTLHARGNRHETAPGCQTEAETRTPAEGMLLEEIERIVATQIVLESKILQQGIYPAVNLHRSRNREEEMFIAPADMARIYVLRKVLAPLSPVEAAKLLGSKLLVTPSNSQFLSNMSSI